MDFVVATIEEGTDDGEDHFERAVFSFFKHSTYVVVSEEAFECLSVVGSG